VNYEELQIMYEKLKDSIGFTVLAFPCNQFGRQEPGSNQEIKEFVSKKFGATFPLFSKIRVNGEDADPLWKFLKYKCTGTLGQSIKWNFTKFLIDRNGVPIKRYGTPTNPFAIIKDIDELNQSNL